MRQEFLMLADGAEATNGKIFILGGGASVHRATDFPADMRADIACSVLIEWGEANRTYAIGLRIIDEDGKVAGTIGFNHEVGRPPGARPGQDLRTLLAVRGPFQIPHPGGYKIMMELDGKPQEPAFHFWVDKVPKILVTAEKERPEQGVDG
jgi:hypothetical protein